MTENPSPLSLSVVIPAFNADKFIARCVTAIQNSSYPAREIIVVDDASEDDTFKIAESLGAITIRSPRNGGPGASRNLGQAKATGDLTVFVDADVMVRKNSLSIIREAFIRDSELTACSGILSTGHLRDGFYTAYKNLYMNYTLKRCDGRVDFLYGSIMGIRKSDFLPFPESLRLVDDTLAGKQYHLAGKKIILMRDLVVDHMKLYSLATLLRNDFLVPFEWARIFSKYRGLSDIFRKKRFAHAKLSQLSSLVLSAALFLEIMALPFSRHWSLVAWTTAFYLIINAPFFLTLARNKGPWFCLSSIVFTWIDQLVMTLRIMLGLAKVRTR